MKDFKQKWWCATYIMANLHLRKEYSVQRSFPIVELVEFFKHSQFYLQNNDFILPDGLYRDSLPKHFLLWPFLTTSLPSLFLTLIPVSSAIAFLFCLLSSQYFESWITKWWPTTLPLPRKISLIVSRFEDLMLSRFISDIIVLTQKFRI